jgi:hypothetical protein
MSPAEPGAARRRSAAHVCVALAALCAVTAARAEPQLCSKTSRRARHACENEVRDDYWLAAAVCANEPEASVRAQCERDARRLTKEGNPECTEQFEARESLCDALGQAAYAPVINPARFLAPAAAAANPNPFFPLVPGRTWSYALGNETVRVAVTDQTKVILGVTCTVVRDVEEQDGVLVEDTDDYFAQDRDGNVWYFGELSRSFEEGQLASLDGSWTAGVDGAKPGLIMKATPAVGDVYRQEFFLGDAEDAAEVLSTTASATVPAAACAGTCVQTRDFTALEPEVEEHKFYAPGIGLILEVDQETGERVELTAFTR